MTDREVARRGIEQARAALARAHPRPPTPHCPTCTCHQSHAGPLSGVTPNWPGACMTDVPPPRPPRPKEPTK